MPSVGLPRDPAQWLALLLALAALAAGRRLVGPSPHRARFLALAALAAAGLSAAYVALYLRGGPRIIDATSYFLEARALAEGLFAWPLNPPSTASLGRFLVRSEDALGARVAVIFPPGYPALLALGFLAGAPMAVGPLLAAALVVTTHDLATRIEPAQSPPGATPLPISIPRLAVLFSVTCAALRYHTADTMSHGLAAVCFAGALALTFRAFDAIGSPKQALALAAGAGALAGWLVATRPVTSLALAITLAIALGQKSAAPRSGRRNLIAALAVGAIPGLVLLLAHQRAATGVLGSSSQQLYYAVSDGPPGCFRYGFGHGIGCVGEHEDFVRAHLSAGYGVIAAAGTTLRRLKLHLVDPLNLEALALLVPIGAMVGWKAPRARLCAIATLAQIGAYVPFYFDGNYPGGGARFFADVLPFEHVLAAIAVVHLAARAAPRARWAIGAAAVALGLAGFAFRAGFDHASLRDRDGGRPMFEPERLAEAGVTRGLLFFDTDHGYNLALDPADSARKAAASGGFEVVRFHGDDLDRWVWEARGRPPAFRYRFLIPSDSRERSAKVTVEPLSWPSPAADNASIEGESLWPPLEQQGGFALASWTSAPCASAARWLAVHADTKGAPAKVRVELPAPFARGRSVSPRVALGAGALGEVSLVVDGIIAHVWRLEGPQSGPVACVDLESAPATEGARRIELVLQREASTAVLALDRVSLVGKKIIDR